MPKVNNFLGKVPKTGRKSLSEIDQQGVRKRIREQIIDHDPQIADEKGLGRHLSDRGLFDRSATRRMMLGERRITDGFLKAIEAAFGFEKRYYVETGTWPDQDAQATAFAKLKPGQYERLIALANSPRTQHLIEKLNSAEPRTLQIIEALLLENSSLRDIVFQAISIAGTATDTENEKRLIRRLRDDIRKENEK